RLARLDATAGSADSFNPNPNSDINAIVVQADGKILVGGNFIIIAAQSRHSIARLDPDGTLDTVFNPVATSSSTVNAIAVQADGKILVGGFFSGATGMGGQTRNRIARLEIDGRLDRTLDLGIVGGLPFVTATAVQPDGKILIGGGFSSVL